MAHSDPISDDALFAHVLGEGSPAERQDIDLAVGASPALVERIARCAQVIDRLRAAGTLSAAFHISPEQAQALHRLAPVGATPPPSRQSGVKEFIEAIANLVFDSWARPAALGLRGIAAERLLRFEFPGGSVDLRISPDAESIGRFWIAGEATGLGPGRVSVRSSQQPQGPETTFAELNESGYFELLVASGSHLLEIHVPAGRFVVGPLDVERR